MNNHFIITLVSILPAFLVPAVFFTRASQQNVFNRNNGIWASVFAPAAVTLLPLMIVTYLLFYDQTDFIHSLNIWQILLPMLFAAAIFAAERLPKYSRIAAAGIAVIGALVCVFTMPEAAAAAVFPLHVWLNRIILAAVWVLFCYAYRYTDSGDGMLALQSFTISGGIGLLAALGALPFIVGLFGWIYAAFFAILLSFSWFPARIRISADNARSLGFALFGLISMAAGENCLPCVAVFAMFGIVDIIWSLLYRLSFREEYRNIINNTAFQQSLQEGMSPRQAANFALRIQLVLLILGCMQIYAPNQLSLIILALLLAVWFSYKFRSLASSNQSIRDINRQVLEDLQDRVNEFKRYINKDDEL